MRTFDFTSLGPLTSGAQRSASDPVINATGTLVAYDSPAPTGAAYSLAKREVYLLNLFTAARVLVSTNAAGAPATGSSEDPSLSDSGLVVAFASSDGDLAPEGSHRATNIYARLASGRIVLVSGGRRGAVANGTASQPEISGNGRYVAFTSTATNLVAGHVSDAGNVYVRDLRLGTTTLVSTTSGGQGGNGWSSNPSIDTAGTRVSFDSAATNLPGSPRGRGPQIYVRDLAKRHTTLVSVTSGGVPQNAAQPKPFRQVSSISGSGTLVAFDSVATNLVRGDINRRSDIFVRNLRDHRTVLISENSDGYEGNSDSFSPTISEDGTKVAFESYATNLAAGGGASTNEYMRDLTLGATSVIDVAYNGLPLTKERVKQLLQRPDLSANGTEAVFESTAGNITVDPSPQVHSFVRFLTPAAGTITAGPTVSGSSVTLTVAADDPAARVSLCRLDDAPTFACPIGQVQLHGLSKGRHVLTIRTGGAGFLYSPTPLSASFTVQS